MIAGYGQLLFKEVQELAGAKVLNASFSDLRTYFEARFRFDVPELKLDQAHSLPPEDVSVEIYPGRGRDFRSPGPQEARGTAFTLVIPFEGDSDMFGFRPSRGYFISIFGEAEKQALVLRLVRDATDIQDPSAVKLELDERVRLIREYLDTQRQEVERWNAELPDKVQSLLEARKQSALKALNVAESLGYPLKRRDAAAYTVPVERKRLTVQMPAATAAPYLPEPRLEMQQYDEILGMVANLVIMMERSPSAFSSMGEEQLRDHILVILNSQFQGQATGETFNKNGKTDILIREKGRNVFIAECKFWDGPKSLTDAIDQILGYACWRDTKIAVILFSRRKEFSAVLAAVPQTVSGHPHCKRHLDYKVEGGFRFLFRQKQDPNRDMTLTILVFDVPTDEPSTAAPTPTQARKKGRPRRHGP